MTLDWCVPPRIVLLNQIVHLNIVKRIVRVWTITSLKSRHLPGFLKSGYGKKVIKDNTVRSVMSTHKVFINLQKIISDPYCPLKDSVRPILSSQEFFIKLHQKLVFYLKHLLKNLDQEQYGLSHTALLEKLDQLL